MKELQAAGCESLRAIAAELDARGIPAARGGKWSAVQVSRLLERVNPSTAQRISRPFDGASVAVASPLGARNEAQQVRDAWAACAPPTDADAELENLGTIASCRVFSAAVGH